MRIRSALFPVVAALAAAASACGGSGESSGENHQTQVETTAAERRADPRLLRPVEPRCGTEGLAAPAISRVATGWRLVYSYPTSAPREARPGEPTIISMDQRHARSRRVKYRNARVVPMAGRKVDVVRQGGNFVAQWVTKRARYAVITDASRARLERLVACTR